MSDWLEIDQHPGSSHCQSCLEDEDYMGRNFDYLCCCKSIAEHDEEESVLAIRALKEKP